VPNRYISYHRRLIAAAAGLHCHVDARAEASRNLMVVGRTNTQIPLIPPKVRN